MRFNLALTMLCGHACIQSSPIVAKGKSPRTDRLLNAEEEVLKVGGNVVRFAGLYISSLWLNIALSALSILGLFVLL